MKKRPFRSLFPVILFILFSVMGCSQQNQITRSTEVVKIPQIENIVSKMSADSVQKYVTKLVSFKTRHSGSDTTSDSVGIGAARRWMFSKFKAFSKRSGGRLQVRYDGYLETSNRRLAKPARIVDVVAVLPGTQPGSKNRKYVVSGHYDSVVGKARRGSIKLSYMRNDTIYAPGAVDDGSGTAAVIEMARVMSQYKFDATLVFMTVAGEEQGLLGSTHYAKEAKKKGWDIAAMFNNDMVGRPDGPHGKVFHGVRVFAEGIRPTGDSLTRHQRIMLYTGGFNDTPERELARLINEVNTIYLPNFKVNIMYRRDRFLRSGDEVPFLRRGYTAVRFTEPHEHYNATHEKVEKVNGVQYGDLLKFVNFDYVANIARTNAASMAMLANAPSRPDSVRMLIAEETLNTTLTWAPNDEPDLKGYRIVWRKTHAPTWQHSKFVGDTARYTIKAVSKDNYLFGVEAVDSSGYFSPAVYPRPAFN